MAEKYKKVYAVDFDGTLCRGTRFPKIGTPNFYLFEFLKEKQKGRGYYYSVDVQREKIAGRSSRILRKIWSEI